MFYLCENLKPHTVHTLLCASVRVNKTGDIIKDRMDFLYICQAKIFSIPFLHSFF